ncbi:MAG: zinc-binding dehydrogenase [Planctomycetota bacterium]
MLAVQIARHGGPEVLECTEIPRPDPGPGEVRVRVAAVSLNHLDVWVRRGMPGVEIPLPHVPGCDGTGVVDAVGADVGGVDVGDPVMLEPGFTLEDGREVEEGNDHLAPDYGIRGEHAHGFAAEFVCLPERYVRRLPEGVDLVDCAAIPLVFLTAWGMLVTRAHVHPDESVLVIGAASGVGSAAIQIAKAEGCHVVATAGSDAKRALGTELGADAVVDHRQDDWPKRAKEFSGGRGFDVVIEHVGPATWAGSLRSLAPGGRLVTCGGTTGANVSLSLPHLFMKNQSILGSTMGPRSAFSEILPAVERGAFRPVVDRRLPIEEVREAHRLLEAREVIGKVVLTF